MRIDRTHRPWMLGAVVLFAVAVAAYIPYSLLSPERPRGGSAMGLAYGIAGYALMLYAGFLGFRKKVRTWRIGTAQTWMRGHLWLGLVTVPLILFHAGFAWRGPLTLVLMILFLIVIASGIFGAVLQHYLPSMITQRVPMETIYEELPRVRGQLRTEADNLIAAICGSAGGAAIAIEAAEDEDKERLREAYTRSMLPVLEQPDREDMELASPTRAAQFFDSLRRALPVSLHPAIQDLENILQEQRQLTRQMRFYRLLHTWLVVHVPVSVVLLLLASIHAIVALRY
jgi:hypothetical protein